MEENNATSGMAIAREPDRRFSLSHLIIKLTSRAFLFTVVWVFMACWTVVKASKAEWAPLVVIIAGVVTALNILGDKVVDAIATAIGNTKITIGTGSSRIPSLPTIDLKGPP
jgi:hypothetical protein